MFKGYIKSNGKKPIERLKDYHKNIEDMGGFDYCGVLDNNIIQIDCDDAAQSELFLRILKSEDISCNILKTTRGIHAYFINDGVDNRKIGTLTPIGIKVDVGLGCRNTVVPLKIDGVERVWLRKCDQLATLPAWLKPVNKAWDLSTSDTRNSDLYTYILPLQSEGFIQNEIMEIGRIINEYIMPEPLTLQEFDTIMRDESFMKPVFFKKNKFLHDDFAKYLIKKYHICKINDNLYFYDGQYTHIKFLNSVMIKEIPHITKTQRNEVLYYINELGFENSEQADVRYINCGNGILDLETMTMKEHTPEIRISNKIETIYNPEAYYEPTDRTLNTIACGDPNLRLLLEEIVGYCLYRRNELGKFFILTGDGGGGKSTYLDMIGKMIGDDNISAVSLQSLSKRFQNTELVGKLVNIGDDVSDVFIDDDSDLKKFVTGEAVQFERKGQDPFKFRNYSKLLFACNKLPRMSDKSNGIQRRMVIVPFNAVFKKDENYDPFIIDKLMKPESIEYLFRIGIEGLKRVLEHNVFTEVESVAAEIRDYAKNNNSVIGFVEDEYKIENEPVREVYILYSSWCHEGNQKPVCKNEFSRELKRLYGFQSKVIKVNQKNTRIYEKI